MKNRIILILLICTAFTGCSAFNGSKGYQSASYREPAKLVNYRFDERFVHIEVLSYGCTVITSFELELVDKETNSLRIIRMKPDNCKVKPLKIGLNYAYRHLGVDNSRPIKIVNPLFNQESVIAEYAESPGTGL